MKINAVAVAVLVALLCAAAPAASVAPAAPAAEEYKIDLTRPVAAGFKYKLHSISSGKAQSGVSQGGETAAKGFDMDLRAELIAEVTVVSAGGDGRIEEAALKVSRCTITKSGATTEVAAPGKVLTAKLDENNFAVFSLDGARLPDETSAALGNLLDMGRPFVDYDAVFGSLEPKKPGDTWPLDPRAAVQMMGAAGDGIDLKSVKGTATLMGVTEVNGVKCLAVKGAITVTDLPGMEGIKPEGAMEWRMAGKFPLDPSLPPLGWTLYHNAVAKVRFPMTAGAEPSTNTMTSASENSYEIELMPRPEAEKK